MIAVRVRVVMRLDVQSEPQREYADHALGIQLRTHVALDVPLELI